MDSGASGEDDFRKNAVQSVLPIASISKLVTSMVVVDAQQDLHQILRRVAKEGYW
jgi:CubicO group peptidase (beta-lactamase class C family)